MPSISSDGRVSYIDEYGNPVIIDTQGQIVETQSEDADEQPDTETGQQADPDSTEHEGGDDPSAAQNPLKAPAADGTDSSASSSTAGKPGSSIGTGSPSPAPTTENLSEADPTASGIAASTAGAGADSPTQTTESSDQPVTDGGMEPSNPTAP